MTVLVLRTCTTDMTSCNGFKWPEVGKVAVAPDWDPNPVCGHGLHGLLKGEGEGNLLSKQEDAKWLLVEVNKKDIVNLSGKVKFPRGKVVFIGTKFEATNKMKAKYPEAAVVFCNTTAPDRGYALAGYGGTATAGDSGTATAGNSGHALAGNYGTATAGYNGKATAGNSGTATAGDSGTATAGNYGKATAGRYGKATAGRYGKATTGYGGTATAGHYGKATAGENGKVSAGNNGILSLSYYDINAGRHREVIGYIGENGLEPNVLYNLDDNKQFIKVT